MKKYIAIAIAAGQLCSCTNMSDTTRTYTESMGLSSLVGAGAGAAIGNWIGGNTKGALWGAGAGALTGLAIGYLWGDYVVKQKREYASIEEQIQHSNQVLDERITQAQQTNSKLKSTIAQLKSQNKKLTASKAKEEIANIDKCISLLSEEATLANAAAKKASGTQRKMLLGKISTLDGEISTLKSNKKALSTLSF